MCILRWLAHADEYGHCLHWLVLIPDLMTFEFFSSTIVLSIWPSGFASVQLMTDQIIEQQQEKVPTENKQIF